MKKLILTIMTIVGTTMVAWSQGSVDFDDYNRLGIVAVDMNGHLSTMTDSYYFPSSFTASLYSLPGNVTTTAGLGADAYGYLSPESFVADGFIPVSNAQLARGGSANGNLIGDGYFQNGLNNGEAFLSGTTGNYNGYLHCSPPPDTAFDVLAIVAWTGTYTSLEQAILGNAQVGIITFVNPIGSGGQDPRIPELMGWDALTPSPAAEVNETLQYGQSYPDLVLGPNNPVLDSFVPEPSTFALTGLAGLSLCLLRRRK